MDCALPSLSYLPRVLCDLANGRSARRFVRPPTRKAWEQPSPNILANELVKVPDVLASQALDEIFT